MLPKKGVITVSFRPDLNLGALQNALFQVGVMNIHAPHKAVRAGKVPRLHGLPNTFDLDRRQRYEIGNGPHERIRGSARLAIFVVVCRLGRVNWRRIVDMQSRNYTCIVKSVSAMKRFFSQ